MTRRRPSPLSERCRTPATAPRRDGLGLDRAAAPSRARRARERCTARPSRSRPIGRRERRRGRRARRAPRRSTPAPRPRRAPTTGVTAPPNTSRTRCGGRPATRSGEACPPSGWRGDVRRRRSLPSRATVQIDEGTLAPIGFGRDVGEADPTGRPAADRPATRLARTRTRSPVARLRRGRARSRCPPRRIEWIGHVLAVRRPRGLHVLLPVRR